MTAEKLEIANELANEIEKIRKAIDEMENFQEIALCVSRDSKVITDIVVTSTEVPGLKEYVLDALYNRKKSLIESFEKL